MNRLPLETVSIAKPSRVRRIAVLALAGVGAVVGAACAPAPLVTFPAGAVTPTPEAAAIWQATTAACRSAANYSAEIVINGRVGSEKLRRVTLQGAMTRDGRIRLLAVAPIGGPIFLLAGRAERATLTLPHDHRVLVAPVADIVNALIGLKFAPADWVDVLSGCVGGAQDAGAEAPAYTRPAGAEAPAYTRPAGAEAPAYRASGGEVGGDIVMSLGPQARALLRKSGAEWRVLAGERPEAHVEYRAFLGRWPSDLRLTSSASADVPIDVRMAIGQIFVNTELQDRAFVAEVPADFMPMTLAELRAIGPLGERH